MTQAIKQDRIFKSLIPKRYGKCQVPPHHHHSCPKRSVFGTAFPTWKPALKERTCFQDIGYTKRRWQQTPLFQSHCLWIHNVGFEKLLPEHCLPTTPRPWSLSLPLLSCIFLPCVSFQAVFPVVVCSYLRQVSHPPVSGFHAIGSTIPPLSGGVVLPPGGQWFRSSIRKSVRTSRPGPAGRTRWRTACSRRPRSGHPARRSLDGCGRTRFPRA